MIRVVVDDLAFVRSDAVIRPATATLEPTTAALRRLEQVGGPAFWQQLKVQQELAVGAAVNQLSGSLPKVDGTVRCKDAPAPIPLVGHGAAGR